MSPSPKVWRSSFTNFCSADFCSTLTFLHLNLGVLITQCVRVHTNFYSTLTLLHLYLTFSTTFSLQFFILLTFLHLHCLEGPLHLATPYIMHPNIPNILSPNWSQYQVSPPPARKIHLFGGVFVPLPEFNHLGNSTESPIIILYSFQISAEQQSDKNYYNFLDQNYWLFTILMHQI